MRWWPRCEGCAYVGLSVRCGLDWHVDVSIGVGHGVAWRGSCGLWLHSLLTLWMLFTVHTLPQLAVSAKLLCLLMVVICGAVPSMVRSVKLYGEKSHKFVKINTSGEVFAEDFNETDDLFNLSIRSIDFKSGLNIYSEKAGRYLCFSKKWKLVGYKNKSKKGAKCEFQETVESRGYSRYRSLVNVTHFLAFNKQGKPLRYNPHLAMGYEEHCINFLKADNYKFNITAHNTRISGARGTNRSPEVSERFRRKRYRGHLLSTRGHKIRHKDKRS